MGEFIKMKGRLLTFDRVDSTGVLFPKGCHIEIPDMMPLLWNFNRSKPDDLMGSVVVHRDDDGLICEATVTNEDLIKILPEHNNEFGIGGFYHKVKDKPVNGLRIVNDSRLAAVSVTLAPASEEYKMVLVEEDK